MRTIEEIRNYMIENKSYGYDNDVKLITGGKVDKHIELLLSSLRPEEEVKFSILATGIYNGAQIVVGGNCILFITTERILYGCKGMMWSTVKSVNIDDCRDVESDTFGILKGTVKINTRTEIVKFETKKSETIRLAGIIEKILKEVVDANKAPATQVVNQLSAADELKKFKELLDSGLITQEEFDAKKKQLLGL
jgi:hypothetical protein